MNNYELFQINLEGLSNENKALLKDKSLGFDGMDDKGNVYKLYPCWGSPSYWIFEIMDAGLRIAHFCEKPIACSRMPWDSINASCLKPVCMRKYESYAEIIQESESISKNIKNDRIYLIRAKNGGPFKVGVAKDINTRLAQLQCGNPQELELVCSVEGSYAKEKRIHKELDAGRLFGEWFDQSLFTKAFNLITQGEI